MELRHLRSFVVLAGELHFGRAAAAIPIAQPALSHHIKQLEREVGARLFERSARVVRLTPAGELFLPHARATLRHAEQAVTAVREQVNGTTGHLRVGVFGNGAAELTVPILRAFQITRPGVQLSIVELDLLGQESAVADDRVDVAFIRPPVVDDRLVVSPLATEPRVAVVPVNHPMGNASMLMVDDILEDPVLRPHPGQPQIWTDYWQLADRRRGHPPREVGPGAARTVVEWLHALVVHDCVATAPASMARYFPFAGLRYIPLADIEACEIAVAHRAGESDPIVLRFLATAHRIARRSARLLYPGADR